MHGAVIDSSANPTVKALRALTTTKGRREQRRFLVEGVRAVEEGLRAGYVPAVCLYNPELLARTERGQALLTSLRKLRTDTGKPPMLLEASVRALQSASDTVHPQGIVAAFPIVDREPPTPAPAPALALICDAIQDPGNLGTILRAAEAAGVHAVWLSPDCVDVYSPKVVRSAMGAHFRLPIYPNSDWPQIERAVQMLGVPATRIFGTDAAARQSYDEVDWLQPAALIISNEAHGISQQARLLAEGGGGLVCIPMMGGTESLNAAIAAAVILFEAARQRRRKQGCV